MTRQPAARSSFPIETGRLRLSPFTRADEDVLYAMFRDDGVRRFLLDGVLIERDWVRSETEGSERRFTEGALGLFLARDKTSDQPIGFAGFRPFHEPPVLELLYGLYPTFWGRGLATEMGRAMLTLAFDCHGFDVVDTAVDAPNVASIRVLERLGLSLVGRSPSGAFGETLYFRLLRTDRHRGTEDMSR